VEGERFRASHAWLGERPLVLYAGTLGKVNAVSDLVKIAAEIRRESPEVRFLVVGDGADREAVASLAAQLGVLGQNFFLLPSVAKEAMPALLAASTITTSLVADIPALAGNSANKVFDGFAAGRPVALNAAGSLGDLLRQTGAGIVLSRDPKVAASQLTDFLADPQALARARDASARLSREAFGRDVLFVEFERAIEEAHREGRVVRKLKPVASVPMPEGIKAPWWRQANSDEGE
jgi:glycosyltransferase involved in cell wall biosynthesis